MTCKSTPWGAPDHVEEYVPGITWYSTPSHGGLKLDRYHNAQAVFPDAFVRHDKEPAKTFQKARDTLRNWHPDAYERFYGVELKPGESFKRDIALFEAAHANDLIVLAASGDWHDKVPEGMVGVCASTGGKRGTGAERYFLVSKEEYSKPRQPGCGMMIDPAIHQEVDPIR